MLAVSSFEQLILVVVLKSNLGGPDAKGERKDNLRAKPLSGKLLVTVNGARELNHAPVPKSRSSSKASPESTVSLKVEGTQLARTHPSRTDRWNEAFEIPVDKANEVEIVVYDKVGVNDLPVGLLWIRISDLVEAQRRQKFGGDVSGGWATAGAMGGNGSSYDMNTNAPVTAGMGGPMGAPAAPGAGGPEGITAWFAVQPAGAIHLELEFGTRTTNYATQSYVLTTLLSQGEHSQTSSRCRGSRSTRRRTQT